MKVLLLILAIFPLMAMANLKFPTTLEAGENIGYVKRGKIGNIEFFHSLKRHGQLNINKGEETVTLDITGETYKSSVFRNSEELVSFVYSSVSDDGLEKISFELYNQYRSMTSGSISFVSGVISIKNDKIIGIKIIEKVSNQRIFSANDSEYGQWMVDALI